MHEIVGATFFVVGDLHLHLESADLGEHRLERLAFVAHLDVEAARRVRGACMVVNLSASATRSVATMIRLR